MGKDTPLGKRGRGWEGGRKGGRMRGLLPLCFFFFISCILMYRP